MPETLLPPTPPDAPGTTVPVPPTAALTLHLASAGTYPSVSVLMNTVPAPAMTAPDAARLDRLVADAARRLRAEHRSGDSPLVDALTTAALDVARAPTGKALALYASSAVSRAVRLDVPVRERVVIDPAFSVRDLVRALHRTPRHVVLLLCDEQASIYDSGSRTLLPADRAPAAPAAPQSTPGPQAAPRQRRGRRRSRDPREYLRAVDARLGTYRRLHRSPLVVVGPAELTAAFLRLSRHAHRLAGTVTADPATVSPAELDALARPVLEEYLSSRQEEALALVTERARQHRVAAGMPAAWLAARTEPVEMLAVDEGLFYPARLSSDGDLLIPADDVEAPDVVDDAVDELVALVLDRGGWIALVDEGRLDGYDGVAVTLRDRTG